MAKRWIGLLLCLLLLVGCADLRLTPARPAVSAEPPAPTAAPRSLAVYDLSDRLAAVLEVYQQSQGVTVTKASAAEAAQLAVFALEPDARMARDLSAEPGYLKNVLEHSPFYGFELGSTQYGYVADQKILDALLGDAPSVQEFSAQDWQSLTAALDRWIREPAGQHFNARGRTYRLPSEKPEVAKNLEAVFAVDAADRFAGPVWSPVLATGSKSPEDWQQKTDHSGLKGAVNSLYTLFSQEAESLSVLPAAQAFAEGRALFCRTALNKVQPAPEQKPVVLPFKFTFDYSDLHGGLPLKTLLSQPVAVSGGWMGIPARSSDTGEALAFLLWLTASEEGRALRPAAETRAQGLPDLWAAVDADTRQAISRLGQEQPDWTRQGRRAYTAGALNALQEEGVN